MKTIESVKPLPAAMEDEAPQLTAAVLELRHARANDAHCLACKYTMLGGADVGLCPKCGSNRWYRTALQRRNPNAGVVQAFPRGRWTGGGR